MWLDSAAELPDLVEKFDFVIVSGFSEPPQQFFGRNSFVIEKDAAKSKIPLEKVQEIIKLSNTKNQIRQLFIINRAEDLSDSAANAFLKLLEEPEGNNAFLFLTEDLSKVLPTVKSRAAIFRLKPNTSLAAEISSCTKEEKDLAKILVARKSYEIVKAANLLAKECSRDSAAGRAKVQRIFMLALKMLEKMLSDNPKPIWAERAEKIETAVKGLAENLNVRLLILSLA
jgi:DNA polymerase III delta prime subunit